MLFYILEINYFDNYVVLIRLAIGQYKCPHQKVYRSAKHLLLLRVLLFGRTLTPEFEQAVSRPRSKKHGITEPMNAEKRTDRREIANKCLKRN